MGLTSSQHLAAVANTEREGVGTVEESFKRLASTIVHQDGLRPTVTGAKNITAKVSIVSGPKNKTVEVNPRWTITYP